MPDDYHYFDGGEPREFNEERSDIVHGMMTATVLVLNNDTGDIVPFLECDFVFQDGNTRRVYLTAQLIIGILQSGTDVLMRYFPVNVTDSTPPDDARELIDMYDDNDEDPRDPDRRHDDGYMGGLE